MTTNAPGQKLTPTPDDSALTTSGSTPFTENVYQTPWQNKAVLGSRQRLRMTHLPDGKGIRVEVLSQNIFNRFIYIFDKSSSSKFTVLKTEEFPEITQEKFQHEKTKLQELYKEHKSIEELLKQVETDLGKSDSVPTPTTSLPAKPAKPLPTIPAKPTPEKPAQPLTSQERAQRHAQIAELRQQLDALVNEISKEETSQQLQTYTQLNNSLKRMKEAAKRSLNHLQELDQQADNPKTNSDALLQEASAIKLASEQGSRDLAAIRQTLTMEISLRETARNLTDKLAPFSAAIQKDWAAQLKEWEAQTPEQVSSIDQVKKRQEQLEGIIAATADNCRHELLENINDARQQIKNTLGIGIPDTLSDQDRQAAVHALRKQAQTVRDQQWEALEQEVATLGDDFNALSGWLQRIGEEKWTNVALIEILDKPPQQGLVEMLYAHTPAWRTLPGASMVFANMPDHLKKVAAFDEIVAYYLGKIPEASKHKTNVVAFLLECQHANMRAFAEECQKQFPKALSQNTHKAISSHADTLINQMTPAVSPDSPVADLQEQWQYDRQQAQHALETFGILEQLATLYEKYSDLSRETERKIASATGYEKIAGDKALDQLKRAMEQFDALEKMETDKIDQHLLKTYKDALKAAGTELGKIDDSENIKALKRAEINQAIDDFAAEIETYLKQVIEVENAYGITLAEAHAAIDQHKKEMLAWKEQGYLPNPSIPSVVQTPLIYYSRAYLPKSVVNLSAHAPDKLVGEVVDVAQLDTKMLPLYAQRVKTEIEIRKHALLHSAHIASLYKAHQEYQESRKVVQEKATAVHAHAASLIDALDSSETEDKNQIDQSQGASKSPSTYQWVKHLVKARQKSQHSLQVLGHLENLTQLYERFSNLAKNAEAKVALLTGNEKIAGQNALSHFNLTIDQLGDFETLEISHVDQALVQVYKNNLEAAAKELDNILVNEKSKVAKRAEINQAIDEFSNELETYRGKIAEVETAYGIKLADAHAALDKHKNEMLKWKERGYMPNFLIPSAMVYYSRAYLPESVFHNAMSVEEAPFISEAQVEQLDVKTLSTYLQIVRNEIEIRKKELQRSSYITEVYKAHQEYQLKMKAAVNRTTTLTSNANLSNIEETNLPKLQFHNADTLTKELEKIKAQQQKEGARNPTAYQWYRQLTADDNACTKLIARSEKTADLSLLDQIRKLDHNPERQSAAKLAFLRSVETRAQKHRLAVKKQLDNLKVHPDIHRCAETLIASAKQAVIAKERAPELQGHLAKLDPLLAPARTEPPMSSAILAQLSYKELQRYGADTDFWFKTTESNLDELKITNDQANAASKLLQEKFDKAEALMDQLDIQDQLVSKAKLKKAYESMTEEKKILSDKEAQKKKRWLPDFSALFSLDTYIAQSPQGATIAALYEYKKNTGKAISILQAAIESAERQKTLTIPEQIALSPEPKIEKELRTRFKNQVIAKIAAAQKQLDDYRTAFGLGMVYIQPNTQLHLQIEQAIRRCTAELTELKERYTTTFAAIDYLFGWLFKTKTPVDELSAAQMGSYLHDVETAQKRFTTEIDQAFGLRSLLKHQAKYIENTTTLASLQIHSLCRQGNYLAAFELEMKFDAIKARKAAQWDRTISSADELKKLGQALKGYNHEIEAAIKGGKTPSFSSQRQIEELKAKRASLTTPQAQRLETYFVKLRTQLAVEIETEQENHKNYLSDLRRDIGELCKEYRLPKSWAASADKAIAVQEAKFTDAGKLPVNWAFGMLTSSKPIREMKIDEIVKLKPEIVNQKTIKASLDEISKVFNIDAIYPQYLEYKAAFESVRESKQKLIDDGQVKHAADMMARVDAAQAAIKSYLKTHPIKLQDDLKPLGDKLKEQAFEIKAAESAALKKVKLTPLEQLRRLPDSSPLAEDLRQLLITDIQTQLTSKREDVHQHIESIEKLTTSLDLPREWRDEIVAKLEKGLSALEIETGKLNDKPGWFSFSVPLNQLKKTAEGVKTASQNIDQIVSTYFLKTVSKEFSHYDRLMTEAQNIVAQNPLTATEDVHKLIDDTKQRLKNAVHGPIFKAPPHPTTEPSPAAALRAKAKAAAEAALAAEKVAAAAAKAAAAARDAETAVHPELKSAAQALAQAETELTAAKRAVEETTAVAQENAAAAERAAKAVTDASNSADELEVAANNVVNVGQLEKDKQEAEKKQTEAKQRHEEAQRAVANAQAIANDHAPATALAKNTANHLADLAARKKASLESLEVSAQTAEFKMKAAEERQVEAASQFTEAKRAYDNAPSGTFLNALNAKNTAEAQAKKAASDAEASKAKYTTIAQTLAQAKRDTALTHQQALEAKADYEAKAAAADRAAAMLTKAVSAERAAQENVVHAQKAIETTKQNAEAALKRKADALTNVAAARKTAADRRVPALEQIDASKLAETEKLKAIAKQKTAEANVAAKAADYAKAKAIAEKAADSSEQSYYIRHLDAGVSPDLGEKAFIEQTATAAEAKAAAAAKAAAEAKAAAVKAAKEAKAATLAETEAAAKQATVKAKVATEATTAYDQAKAANPAEFEWLDYIGFEGTGYNAYLAAESTYAYAAEEESSAAAELKDALEFAAKASEKAVAARAETLKAAHGNVLTSGASINRYYHLLDQAIVEAKNAAGEQTAAESKAQSARATKDEIEARYAAADSDMDKHLIKLDLDQANVEVEAAQTALADSNVKMQSAITAKAAAAAELKNTIEKAAAASPKDAIAYESKMSMYYLLLDQAEAEAEAAAAEKAIPAAKAKAANATKAAAKAKTDAVTAKAEDAAVKAKAAGSPSIIPSKMESLSEALSRCAISLQSGINRINHTKPPNFAALLRKHQKDPLKYDQIRDALREDLFKKLTDQQTAIDDYHDKIDKIDNQLQKLVGAKITQAWRTAVEQAVETAQNAVSNLIKGYPQGTTVESIIKSFDDLNIDELIDYEEQVIKLVGTHKPGRARDPDSLLSQLESEIRLETIHQELTELTRAFNGLANCITYLERDRYQENNKAILVAMDLANKQVIEESAANLEYIRGGAYFCNVLEFTKASILRAYSEYQDVKNKKREFSLDPWAKVYKFSTENIPPDEQYRTSIDWIIKDGYGIAYTVNDPNPRDMQVQYTSIDTYITEAQARLEGADGKPGIEQTLNAIITTLDPSAKNQIALLEEALEQVMKYKDVLADLKRGMKVKNEDEQEVEKKREEITKFADLLAYRNYTITQICQFEEFIFDKFREYQSIKAIFEIRKPDANASSPDAAKKAAASDDDDDDDIDLDDKKPKSSDAASSKPKAKPSTSAHKDDDDLEDID